MTTENSKGENSQDEYPSQQRMFDGEPVEEYFNGLEHSSLKKSKIGLKFPGVTEIPLVIAGAGLLVLIVFLSIFIFTIFVQKPEKVDVEGKFDGKLRSVDARINQLEGRLSKMEVIVQQLLEMENRGEEIGPVVARINKLESEYSSQLDLMSQKLDHYIKQQEEERKKLAALAVKPPEKTTQVSATKATQVSATKATQMPAKKSVKTYHHVQSGETLYSIGRKYKMSLDQLHGLNPSISGNAIYTGQKIRVK